MSILPAAAASFAADTAVAATQVAVVGAGACGLVAALMAKEAGAEALVFERDAAPQGSTAMSSGMIMACATRFQRAKGIADSVALMARDILAKNKGEADPAQVETICRESGPAVEWLAGKHAVPLDLVEGFLYPGHSVLRMHAPPSRSGAELIGALTRAAAAAGVDIVTNAQVTALFADGDGRVAGLRHRRPDGVEEDVGCRALVLACSGFGGNKAMVRRYIPAMAEALYFGHAGNRGDAMAWGEALGAALADMGAYQGHGSVAHPHGALVTWALMMEGGFQVNARGERFSNEHRGYSEQAVDVIAQPGGIAWDIFDARLHALGRAFEDYRQAEAAGAVLTAPSAEALAEKAGLPSEALARTVASAAALARGETRDPFSRDFTGKPALAPPYCAIRVTGALFHTQGGLVVDGTARVLRKDGSRLPNLFAGGGAARGISGAHVWGYLSGNGLLPAVTLGRIAGREAARLSRA
ncbi:MAG TPA: FAD-dependent oxidoreductase [Alphaproteobacteria bacterium]|jgi:fumarate reductase flavoprotein subunit